MKIREILITIASVALAIILLPYIGWLALILVIAAVLFMIVMYFKSASLRKEIEKDPNAYFAQQAREHEREMASQNAIDVEYKEKEIESE